jgi:orotate phosphoribosyltransferase
MQNTENTWPNRKREFGRQLMHGLYEKRLFKTWYRDRPQGWELVSGLWSPFYIQVRHIPSHPLLLSLASFALGELIREEAPEINRLIGVASAGVPLATATGLKMGFPVGYTRKLPGVRSVSDLEQAESADDKYGEHAQIEGDLANDDRIGVVDDVAAKFSSKEVALRQIEMEAKRRGIATLSVPAVIVLVDREQGAEHSASLAHVSLLSLVKLRSQGLDMLTGLALPREIELISQYLEAPESFQDPVRRAELEAESRANQSEIPAKQAP